ncbi:dNA topoisomerase IV A subunit [Clostridium sp. CAG:1000]|nr:dNA topoisomerase IV A subunit [Clostridium sp. CAG:1000]
MKNDILKRIQDYALEEIMGDRFSKYAKEIILDRAIPDVRDGLKPVQRRILYAMYKAGNTWDKGYIKCAATVGDVLGKFHPHGDSSVYDAMVRMSQWWKQNSILVDIHGNNGSMDGDQAAAYRYTEAKLAHISKELLGDLEKDTVKWAPNFDDRFLEPTVLPAKFPNLLVNGANGISAGYATNIPPHNLGEIIDATIKRIDSPNCRLDTILEIVKGPDFPTGAIVEGKQGIIDAFTTGRGKVIVKSKTEFKKEKGREQIIITEIPFDVNKATLVQKIDSLRIDKKIDGISEVRDETDREGLRIAIDLKSGANKEFILNYLLKNTDLQISYNYNMVAIVNRTPKTLGIIPILDAYIDHFTEVITNRTKFDLAAYQKEFNIVSGLIKAISILDEVIKTIRSSKNKSDAKVNLVEKYDFTIEQAEAIVMLQLYKLTNTDVVVLEERSEKLKELIKECEKILNDENELKSVMKSELREIKKQYATPRKTEIKSEITEIKIDELDMISKDDFIVCISKTGYVKKISLKSYNSSNTQELPAVKENDYIEGFYKINNIDTIILFTNLGNFLYLPVRDIQEAKYKDLGTHISNYIKVSDDEKIIRSIGVDKFDDTLITAVTKNGMIKKMRLKEFAVSRYSKPITMFKLKDDDEVVSVSNNSGKDTVIVTNSGYALRFNTDEIPEFGLKAGGVKAIKLSDDDVVSSAFVISENKEYLAIFTDKNTAKRIKVEDIEMSSRAKKGSLIIKSPKSKKYSIFKAFNISSKSIVGIVDGSIGYLKSSDINIMDKQSVGSVITKKNIDNIFVVTKLKEIKSSELKEKETKKETSDEVKPKEEKQLTMSDFFEEFKI